MMSQHARQSCSSASAQLAIRSEFLCRSGCSSDDSVDLHQCSSRDPTVCCFSSEVRGSGSRSPIATPRNQGAWFIETQL